MASEPELARLPLEPGPELVLERQLVHFDFHPFFFAIRKWTLSETIMVVGKNILRNIK
jgi:hypothetical protein